MPTGVNKKIDFGKGKTSNIQIQIHFIFNNHFTILKVNKDN